MKVQTKKAQVDSQSIGPFTPGIFGAISKRPCKLLVIQVAAESPVIYMGDLDRHKIALEIAAEIATEIARQTSHNWRWNSSRVD